MVLLLLCFLLSGIPGSESQSDPSPVKKRDHLSFRIGKFRVYFFACNTLENDFLNRKRPT